MAHIEPSRLVSLVLLFYGELGLRANMMADHILH